MMKPTDRLLAPSRGDPEVAIAFAEAQRAKRLGDVTQLIHAFYRYAAEVGLDAGIATALAFHETGNFTNRWWVERLNAGSLGVTGDPSQNERSGSWASGEAAALAVLHHLGLYVGVDMLPWKEHNPRWQAAVTAGYFGIAETLDDLAGRWAVDRAYGSKIAAKGGEIWPGLPDQQQEKPIMAIPTTFSVPRPPIYNLATDYARFGLSQSQANEIIGSRFPNRNGGRGDFLVFHIQDGRTPGSLQYWSSDAVDASSTIMAQIDGSLLYIVPREHAPWTNGDLRSPTAQANEILARGGNPNLWSLTCEAEGIGPVSHLPEKQRDAMVWWAEDEIMRNPKILDSDWCLLAHRFINSETRSNCGLYLQEIVDPINEWLDGAATVPTPDPEPEPVPLYPPGLSPELARVLYGSVTVSWASKPFGFAEDRSECQMWLAQGKLGIKPGEDYTGGTWPALKSVTRRGNKRVHVYRWDDGSIYEKVIRKDP